jgi:hypothetical protein
MNFLIFLLATIGATLIVTQSYIFKPIRDYACKISPKLGKLLHCSMCFGFWTSFIIQFIILAHERMSFIFYWSDMYYIIYGFIGSLASYITYLLIKGLMDKYD